MGDNTEQAQSCRSGAGAGAVAEGRLPRTALSLFCPPRVVSGQIESRQVEEQLEQLWPSTNLKLQSILNVDGEILWIEFDRGIAQEDLVHKATQLKDILTSETSIEVHPSTGTYGGSLSYPQIQIKGETLESIYDKLEAAALTLDRAMGAAAKASGEDPSPSSL